MQQLMRGPQQRRCAAAAREHHQHRQQQQLLQAPSSARASRTLAAAARKTTGPASKRRTDSVAAPESEDVGADESAARQLALRRVLDQINHKHGAGAVMRLGQQPMQIATTPSGCLTLDRALGGGYPRGRIVEIFGPESSGKTTLALHAVAEAQRAGGTAVFIDAEHAFDAAYARRLGVKADELIVSQPDHGEQAFNIMDDLIRSGAVDVVVVDSVSALVPRSEIDGDIGMPAIGAQARLMSQALRKVAGNASKSGVTVIFINQLRYKVGVIYGSPETTSGGQALKFYASCRLDIRAKEKIMEAGRAEPIGVRARVKVVKNKVAAPFEVAEFDILFGEGIHALGCVLDAAEATGVVARRGAWYYFGEQRLGQGRDRALAALREDGALCAVVEGNVRELMAARRQKQRQGTGSGLHDDGEGEPDEEDATAMVTAEDEEEEDERAAALIEAAAAAARDLLEGQAEAEMATVGAAASVAAAAGRQQG